MHSYERAADVACDAAMVEVEAGVVEAFSGSKVGVAPACGLREATAVPAGAPTTLPSSSLSSSSGLQARRKAGFSSAASAAGERRRSRAEEISLEVKALCVRMEAGEDVEKALDALDEESIGLGNKELIGKG